MGFSITEFLVSLVFVFAGLAIYGVGQFVNFGKTQNVEGVESAKTKIVTGACGVALVTTVIMGVLVITAVH